MNMIDVGNYFDSDVISKLNRNVYYRLLIGLCILLFPITILILAFIGIKALIAKSWELKHCLTPEQFEQQLAIEGRIALIQN